MSDYEKLTKLIDEIDLLIQSKVTSDSPQFISWQTKVIRFIRKNYGKDSYEMEAFDELSFFPFLSSEYTDEDDYIFSCRNGLKRAKAIISAFLDDMDCEQSYQPDKVSTNSTDNSDHHGLTTNIDFSKIFIVHGHDEALKQAVARIIERQKIDAIILSEQSSAGSPTVIEKIEANSDVGAAVCLFTADDISIIKNENNEIISEKYRARQNVIFEAGYFMGKLGRDKVIIIADKKTEIPSDLIGPIYVDTDSWKIDLLKNLKAIGYNVDFNLIF